MIFKDEAQRLIVLFEDGVDGKFLAARASAILSRLPDVPEEVLTALDNLVDGEKVAASRYIVTRYLRPLAGENRMGQAKQPSILLP